MNDGGDPTEQASHRLATPPLRLHQVEERMPLTEFGSGENEFRVRVGGPLIMNSVLQILDACLAGVGLAQLPDTQVRPYLDSGALTEVLGAWSDSFPGYHLYYPSRRQQTAAFRVVLDALRDWQAPG